MIDESTSNAKTLLDLQEIKFEPHSEIESLRLYEKTNDIKIRNVPGLDSYRPIITSKPALFHDVHRAYTESAHSFIADVWCELLSLNSPPEREIYFLWNKAIPKPNVATSLFWLLNCESWPIAESADKANREGISCFTTNGIIPPQSTGYEFSSNQPYSYSRAGRFGHSQKSLHKLMADGLTRFDREQMAVLDSQHTVVYDPDKDDFLDHNIKAGIACGLAQETIRESIPHLTELCHVRNVIMHGATIVPGLPTHQSSIYGLKGAYWRAWSESHFGVDYDGSISWTNNGDEIHLGETSLGTKVPTILPRIWFGWTDLAARNDWIFAYLTYRRIAIRLLLDPNKRLIDSVRTHTDVTRKREALLRQGKRIRGNEDKTPKRSVFGIFEKQVTDFISQKD